MPSQQSFDVAISFAGEDRRYASALAEELTYRGLKVFYDEYEKHQLLGKDLYVHLQDVYKNQSQLCILLISQHYANNLWTNHERRAAQARALGESWEYIIPVRLDETEIPGLLPTVTYLSFPPETPETIADTIVSKLRDLGHKISDTNQESDPIDEYVALIMSRLINREFETQENVNYSGYTFRIVATNYKFSSLGTLGLPCDLSVILSVRRLIDYGQLLEYAEICARYAYTRRRKKWSTTICLPSVVTSSLNSLTASSIAEMQPLGWPSTIRATMVGGVLYIPTVFESQVTHLHYTKKTPLLKAAVWPTIRGQIEQFLHP